MKRLFLATLLLVHVVGLAPWHSGVGGNVSSPIATAAANETRGRPAERQGRAREAERDAADARAGRAERSESAPTGSFREQRRLPEAFERSELYKWEYGKFDGRTLRNSVPDRPDVDTIRDHLRARARLEGDSGSKSLSMYSDLPTAERATETVLRRNRAAIERWLQDPRSEQQAFTERFSDPVGVTLDVRSGGFSNANASTVVLRRTADGRFSVVESYPEAAVPSGRGGNGPVSTQPLRDARFLDGVTVYDRSTNRTLRGTVDLKPTLDRISEGKTFPHRNDGTEFRNDPLPNGNRPLPPQPPQSPPYYLEYVVPTPGAKGPGPQRLVTGKNGEVFYTPDHYTTFIQVRP